MKTKFIFNILSALLIGSVVSAFFPVDALAVSGGVVMAGLSYSALNHFVRVDVTNGLVMGAVQADIFKMEQLQVADICRTAILQQYGWQESIDGKINPKPGKRARELPKILDELRVQRGDLFQIVEIGGDGTNPGATSFDLFNKAQDPAKPFLSNFREANLSGNQFRIFAGLKIESSTAAGAAAAISTLDFVTPTDEEILNGIVTYEINRLKEFEDQNIKSLIVNDDPIKNYIRFPRLIVWEPESSQQLTVKLAAAFGATTYRHLKCTLMGWSLSK